MDEKKRKYMQVIAPNGVSARLREDQVKDWIEAQQSPNRITKIPKTDPEIEEYIDSLLKGK